MPALCSVSASKMSFSGTLGRAVFEVKLVFVWDAAKCFVTRVRETWRVGQNIKLFTSSYPHLMEIVKEEL